MLCFLVHYSHRNTDATLCCIKLIRLTCYLIRHPAGNINIHLMANAGIINTSAATLQTITPRLTCQGTDMGHLEVSWIWGVSKPGQGFLSTFCRAVVMKSGFVLIPSAVRGFNVVVIQCMWLFRCLMLHQLHHFIAIFNF